MLGRPSDVQAQLTGVYYIHTDSLTVSTAGVDSVFKRQWEDLTIWSRGGDFEFRASTGSDTVRWKDRDMIRVAEGQMISFGPATKVARMRLKGTLGTVTVYFVGLKKVKMFQ